MRGLKLNRETLRVLNRDGLRKAKGARVQSIPCVSNGGAINPNCLVSNGCTPYIYTQGNC